MSTQSSMENFTMSCGESSKLVLLLMVTTEQFWMYSFIAVHHMCIAFSVSAAK